MRYKAIPVLIFLLIGSSLLLSAYAQLQIGEKIPGFITSTLDGKQISLNDYWEHQIGKALTHPFGFLVPTFHQKKIHEKLQFS